ncbi:hypothetical protein LRP86_04380 [Pseudomonas brassicacearum]|nr:hypothetical protein LRP86_04380 [Pseudomonas brassicacearum]
MNEAAFAALFIFVTTHKARFLRIITRALRPWVLRPSRY